MTEEEMKAQIIQAHIDGHNRGYAKANEELENKIADIKANCDFAIEGRDVKIMELEKLNSNQAESLRITMLEEENKGKCIAELEKENAELDMKRKAERKIFQGIVEKKNEQLTKAKELINLFIQWNYGCCKTPDFKDLVKQAEQFLKGENIILEDAQAGNSPFDADEVFNKEMKAYSEEKVK